MDHEIDKLIELGLHGQPSALDEAIDRSQDLHDNDIRDWYLGKIIRALLQIGSQPKAMDLADQIQDLLERKDVLLAIADSLIITAKRQKAESVLAEAEKTISAIISDEEYPLWQKAEALERMALLISKIERADKAITLRQQAIEVAKLGQKTINNPQEQVDCAGVLAEIALDLAHAGDFILAKSVANEIYIDKRRNETLDTIAAIEKSVS